jgi:hypothetical protein
VSLRESETKIEQGDNDALNPRLLITRCTMAWWLSLCHKTEAEVRSRSKKQERKRRPKRNGVGSDGVSADFGRW